jgi:hypothetical protein
MPVVPAVAFEPCFVYLACHHFLLSAWRGLSLVAIDSAVNEPIVALEIEFAWVLQGCRNIIDNGTVAMPSILVFRNL